MTDLIKKFYQGQRWNAFESIFYKAVLLTHQACLFYFAPKLVYGFSSLLFAIIYLTVDLINLGFDPACAQLSVNYFESKTNFKNYFVPQIIIQIIIWAFLFKIVITNYQFINLKLLPCNAFLSQNQWCLIGVIIICESIRKTLRLLTQLLFINKLAAILESSLILIYVLLFWFAILLDYQVNINTIYLPLLTQSLIGIFFLFYFIFNQVKSHLKSSKSDLSWLEILYIRFQNYAYQLSELLFSSNFLIYFLSSITGLLAIGSIKLANYLAVFIKALLERTFGLTSLAIFVKNKHLISDQKTIFLKAQKTLSLILITILLSVSLFSLLYNSFDINFKLALLFFSFTLINNFLIVYEQLFLARNKIKILFLLNLACICMFLGFVYYNANAALSPQNLIIWLIICRSITLLIGKIITNRFF